MLLNYLRVAFRGMRRQPIYTLVNMVGLTIGIVSALLIAIFVRYELSYESSLEGASHVYRVVRQEAGQTLLGSDRFAVLSAPLARTLEADIPEIESATGFDDAQALLSVGEDHFFESGLLADQHFFQVFGYPILAGDPGQILTEPRSIALSEGLAERLFGSTHAVGRAITYATVSGDAMEFTVSGVFADVAKNSHLQFEYVASILSDEYYLGRRDVWGSFSWYTYFRIRDGQSVEAVRSKVSALPQRYYRPETRREFHIQPAASVHLGPSINNDIAAHKGDLDAVYLLLGVGLAILLLACVNYTNLAVATSVKRAREVGVRKAIGAVRRQIISQFLSQSVLTTVLATVLSLGIVWMILPRFSLLVSRDLSFLGDGLPGVLLMAVLFLLMVGLVGGLYPAFLAARLQPALILKAPRGTGRGGARIRRSLVALQFVVSITLIGATLIIFRQVQFVQSKDVGYERDRIVTVQVQDPALRGRLPEIEQTLMQHAGIVAVSNSRSDPTNVNSYTYLNDWTGHQGDDEFRIYRNPVGFDFLDVYQIPIVMGRGFSRDHSSDQTSHVVIINETAFRMLGWTDLDGKYVVRGDDGGQPIRRPVIGVVRDFHMHSLRQEVKPLMLSLETTINPRRDRISAKIAAAGVQGSLQFIEQTLQAMSAFPVQIRFVDEVFGQLYEQDRKLSQMVGLFALVALLVGALGLFGLVAYTAEMRTKEIGVRKALGASAASILQLFAKDYAGLIVIGGLVGTPLAYVVMYRWLSQFAYRIELGVIDFLMPIALLMIVSACSMAGQTLRAAATKPVDALRHE